MAPPIAVVFPTIAQGPRFESRLGELLGDCEELEPRVQRLAAASGAYRDALAAAQSCGGAVCGALRELFAGELGERLVAGPPRGLQRVLEALGEMADSLGELSQQVDAHLCEGVQRRWVDSLLPGVQTHKLCMEEARAFCQEVQAAPEGEALLGGRGNNPEYAARALDRASASLASEVGQVSVLMRHEFMEAATALFHSHLRFFTQGQKMAVDLVGVLPPLMEAIQQEKEQGRGALVKLDRQLYTQRGFDAMDMRQAADSLTPAQVEQQMQEGWAGLLAMCYSLSGDPCAGSGSLPMGAAGAAGVGTALIDSDTIQRIVSDADALLAQLPPLLRRLAQAGPGQRMTSHGASSEERVQMYFHCQVQLMLDCLAADAAHSLCKSDIKKVLAWTYGYKQLLHELGGAAELQARELLQTSDAGRNEGKAPAELLIQAYLARLRAEHWQYIANVIRADYCADAPSELSVEQPMEQHKLTRGARDLFHILKIEAEDAIGLVGGAMLHQVGHGLLESAQRYQATLHRSLRDSAGEITRLDLCTFLVSATASSDMTIDLTEHIKEAIEDVSLQDDLDAAADGIARAFLEVAKEAATALSSTAIRELHGMSSLFSSETWRGGKTALEMALTLQRFFDTTKAPMDRGSHRRLVAQTLQKLAEAYVAALMDTLPPVTDLLLIRIRADIEVFSELVAANVSAHDASHAAAGGGGRAPEAPDLLEPLPAVVQLLADDEVEGVVLAYYSIIRHLPSFTTAKLGQLLRCRRDLSRAQQREIVGQCLTLHRNVCGPDSAPQAAGDVVPAAPLTQQVQRALAVADRARSGLLSRLRTYSLKTPSTGGVAAGRSSAGSSSAQVDGNG